MPNQNIPEIFIKESVKLPNLIVYDFKMTTDVVKSKVNLNMHMFSFLQAGAKQVHFANNAIAVNKDQSLLVKKGNCLFTELLMNDKIYYCKLLFFSDDVLNDFFNKHANKLILNRSQKENDSYFTIKNDDYINSFVQSLSSIQLLDSSFSKDLLSNKFNELLLYLLSIYGNSFADFLHELKENKISTFRSNVESNAESNLKLEEIAFLCNMSLSTFKRHFIKEFKESPGKWLKKKRLAKAKEILEIGKKTASEIYINLGYNNLSNFSTAFKNEFGISPNKVGK